MVATQCFWQRSEGFLFPGGGFSLSIGGFWKPSGVWSSPAGDFLSSARDFASKSFAKHFSAGAWNYPADGFLHKFMIYPGKTAIINEISGNKHYIYLN
jgi:hypothetical protein